MPRSTWRHTTAHEQREGGILGPKMSNDQFDRVGSLTAGRRACDRAQPDPGPAQAWLERRQPELPVRPTDNWWLWLAALAVLFAALICT